MLSEVRTAEWQTDVAELDDIVEVLAEYIQQDNLDFVFSLCDALLRHDLTTYPAFYRAVFQVFTARSQPDDSDPDAEGRLKIAKALLEEKDENSQELWDELKPRVEKLLKLVNESLQDHLLECPPPGHPDRRETRKLYPGMEGWGVYYQDSEESDLEDTETDPEPAVQGAKEPESPVLPTYLNPIEIEEQPEHV